MNPPLESPEFPPATVRQCIPIRTTVLVQNIEEPGRDIIILTPVSVSVESMLLRGDHPQDAATEDVGHAADAGADGDEGDSELTDFFDSSSDHSDYESSTDDNDDDSEGGSGGSNDGGTDRMEVDDDDDDGGGSGSDDKGDEPDRNRSAQTTNRTIAFLKGNRPLRENPHGAYTSYIYHARVLHLIDGRWVATGREVAIKQVSWSTVRRSRRRTSEDILKEIAALRHVSDWHGEGGTGGGGGGGTRRSTRDTCVLAADAIMSCESELYIVMPYCGRGDLLELVAERDELRLKEDEARYWFRQILKGLESLQLMQLCHKDLSPENFILLDNASLVIDFGMCLRIPYTEAGRHLITPKIRCGKSPHVAPEIWRQSPFDGHAVDIWAAGTVLLFLLTGMRLPNPELVERILQTVDLGLSFEALDLLRTMLRWDPSRRMSLEQIRNHRWVQQEYM